MPPIPPILVGDATIERPSYGLPEVVGSCPDSVYICQLTIDTIRIVDGRAVNFSRRPPSINPASARGIDSRKRKCCAKVCGDRTDRLVY